MGVNSPFYINFGGTMQDKIKKLQEFTQVVKANLDSMYREGSAEANKISPAEVVNTFAILDMSEKLDKLIELLTPKVEAPKAPAKK